MKTLPEPEVLRCSFDEGFSPPLATMVLRWPGEVTGEEWSWELPGGVCFQEPPPRNFGLSIQRWADDRYAVCLVWNSTCLRWPGLTRTQLLAGDLSSLLSTLGTDLHYLLAQPILLPERKLTRTG